MEKLELCPTEFGPLLPGNLLGDFQDALREAVHLQDSCKTYLVQYHLTQDADLLSVLFGDVKNQQIQSGVLKNEHGETLIRSDVTDYLAEFHAYFGGSDSPDFKHDKRLITLVTRGLHLFYLPFFSSLAERIHVIFHFSTDTRMSYGMDLSQIYNLHFLLIERPPMKNDFIVSQSSTAKLSSYVKALASTKKPVPADISIVFGLFPLQAEEDNVTKKIYKKALEKATQAGAKVHEFKSIDQLFSLFKEAGNPVLVQIIGHFHYDRLIMNGRGIRLKTIVQGVKELRENNNLSDRLTIDGINCSNFNEFNSFYDAGVTLVYSSFNDLNALLMAFLLYEMYSVQNARALGITDSYLDGETYLHEAYDLITRIFIHISAIRNEQIAYSL